MKTMTIHVIEHHEINMEIELTDEEMKLVEKGTPIENAIEDGVFWDDVYAALDNDCDTEITYEII